MSLKSQKNGSDFEKERSVIHDILASEKYDVVPSGHNIFYVFEKGTEISVATIIIGRAFYTYLKEHTFKDDWRTILSKEVIPDMIIIVGNVWHIIEYKYQEEGNRSQDDILPYCDFRVFAFTKLIKKGAGFIHDKIEFHYILSKNLDVDRLGTVFEYIEYRKYDYNFEQMPLDKLGL